MSKKNGSSTGRTVTPAASPAAAAPAGASVPASAKPTVNPGAQAAPARSHGVPAAMTVPAMRQSDPGSNADDVRADLLAALGDEAPAAPAQDTAPAAASVPEADDADPVMGLDEPAPEQTEAGADDQITAGDEAAAAPPAEPDGDSHETDPAEPTAEAGEEPGDDEALDALARERKWPASYLRRIKKLTAAKREAETAAQAEVSRLQTELEEARSNPAAVKAAVTDVEQALSGEIEQLERVLDFVDDNADGGQTPDGRNWTREELRAERRKAERALREKEMALTEVRKTREVKAREIETLLPQRHPALKDKTSDHAQAVDQMLRRYPLLKADPVLRLMAADALAYNLALTRTRPAANGANGAAPAQTRTVSAPPAAPAPRPAARAAGRPVAQAPALNGRAAQSQAAHKQFMETGDAEAGRRFIETNLLGD